MEIQNENPNFNHGSSVIAVVPNSSVLARPSEEQGEISALRLYYRTFYLFFVSYIFRFPLRFKFYLSLKKRGFSRPLTL